MPQKAKPECLFDPDWQDAVNEALEALAEQLDTIEDKLNHILDDLHGQSPIIPELARAIARTAILTHRIDMKVPDQPKPKGK